MKKFTLMLLLALTGIPVFGQNQSIFSDGLDNGWQNWSWAPVNLADTTSPHAGAVCLSVSGGS